MFAAYARFKLLHELLAAATLVGQLVPAAKREPLRQLAASLIEACEREAAEPGVMNLPALSRSVRLQLAGCVTVGSTGGHGTEGAHLDDSPIDERE